MTGQEAILDKIEAWHASRRQQNGVLSCNRALQMDELQMDEFTVINNSSGRNSSIAIGS